jgi:hypothetical protein
LPRKPLHWLSELFGWWFYAGRDSGVTWRLHHTRSLKRAGEGSNDLMCGRVAVRSSDRFGLFQQIEDLLELGARERRLRV